MEINVLEIGALITAFALFGALYFLKRKHVDFGIRTLIATAFGVIIGLIFKENYNYVHFLFPSEPSEFLEQLRLQQQLCSQQQVFLWS